MKTVNAMHVNILDNCVTLADHTGTGDMVCFLEGDTDRTIIARGSIPIWHKMAIRPVKKGGDICKYGNVIGIALDNIEAGDHVHVHNLRSCVIG